jgi:hypothetical protein
MALGSCGRAGLEREGEYMLPGDPVKEH